MKHPSFSDLEYASKKRRTKRELFLEKLDKMVPWDRLLKRIKPLYYQNKLGRPATDLEVVLRVYTMQLCYNMSDFGM